MSEITPEQHEKLALESQKYVQERLDKLEAAITKIPLPGKKKPPPLKTIWRDFIYSVQAELNFGLKSFECSTFQAFGDRFSSDGNLREKVKEAISKNLLVGQPALLVHYSDKVGQTHQDIVEYGRGFGALLLFSRLLKELGLDDDGEAAAYQAYTGFRDFAQTFDGPGPSLVDELGKPLKAELLKRVGWPDVHDWCVSDYTRVRNLGASAERPPAD